MAWCSQWMGFLVTLFFSFGTAASGQSLCYEFNTDGDAEGWWLSAGSSSAGVSNGVLTYVSDGSASRISTSVSLAVEDYQVLRIRMRAPVCQDVDSLLEVTAQFRQQGASNYLELGQLTHAPGEDWFILEFDTSACSAWTGSADSIRILLNGWSASTASDTFEIDYIHLAEPFSFSYEFNSTTDGWDLSGCSAVTNSSSLTLVSSGTAPRIARNVTIANPQATPYVMVKYRPVQLNSANTELTARLRADDGSGAKLVGEIKHAVQTNGMKILIFDLRKEPIWQAGHTISFLRFEPDGWSQGSAAGDVFEIDSIQVSSQCPQWRWDFDESTAPNTWRKTSMAAFTTDPSLVINGGGSLLVNTTNDEIDWRVFLSLFPLSGSATFPCDARFEVEFNYKILAENQPNPGDDHSVLFIWPDPCVARNVASGKSGSAPIDELDKIRFCFAAPNDPSGFEVKLGAYNGIQAVIDDVVVRMKPRLTADDVAATGESMAVNGYEPYGIKLGNLNWASDFPTTNDVLYVMDMAQLAGVQWVRLGAEEEKWLYEAAQARGMCAYACLNIPDSLKDLSLLNLGWEKEALPATNAVAWHNYIDERYAEIGDLTDYWEIGNEINHRSFYPDYDAYVDHYIDTAQYLKLKSSKNRIAPYGMGKDGIVALKHYGANRSFERLFQNGAGPYIDWFSFHVYRENIAQSVYHVNELLKIADQYGYPSIPVWITEIGLNIGTLDEGDGCGGTLQKQADLLADTYTQLLNHPRVEKVFWFNMVYRYDPDVDFGICEKWDYVDPDSGDPKPYEPRPAYWTLYDRDHLSTTQRVNNSRFLDLDGLQ